MVQDGADTQGKFDDEMGVGMDVKDADEDTLKDTAEHISTTGASVTTASTPNIAESAAQTLVEIRENPINDLLEIFKVKQNAKKAATRKNKPITQAQMMRYMKNYLKNQDHYTERQLQGRSYEQIQHLYSIAYKKVQAFYSNGFRRRN